MSGGGPVSILDVATARAKSAGLEPPITGEDFYREGFDILGGCWRCHATIAAYNAHPTTRGFWACNDCVGDEGFITAEEFEEWAKEGGCSA